MKYFLLTSSLILLLGCNRTKSDSSSPEKIVSNPAKIELTEASQLLKIDTLNEWTLVKNDTIKIRTEKQGVEFISRPYLEENTSKYTYNGFNEINLFHTVCGQYWEHIECYLIDHKTARIDTVWTEPIFSPDNGKLVSKSMDYGLEGIPNGFQAWRLNEDRNWIKVLEIDQQEWIPIQITWTSNKRIRVKTVTIAQYHQMNELNDNFTEFIMKEFDIEN